MANEVYVQQRNGSNGPFVLRKITPTAGQVLGFNSSKNLVSIDPNDLVSGMVVQTALFTEDATSVTHTVTIPIPAGAILHEIQVDAGVLWTDSSATLKVGDTADDDGYFIGVNLAATDLLVNEQLRISNSTLWGGKNGAYLVAATGQRGPTTTNFGGYYAAGSNITGIVSVTTPSGTAGRTKMTVWYSVGNVNAPVLA